MNSSNEKIVGTKSVAQRIVNAENNFIKLVREKGYTLEQAQHIFEVFKKLKMIKLDAVIGVYNVKHGAYWESVYLDAAKDHKF